MTPENPEHILLLFVDGLGIGPYDLEKNPCAHPPVSFFSHFQEELFPKVVGTEGFAMGLDACLGVPGLPQSATGQTALLTGVNAAQTLGRHLNGFPNSRLRELIASHSIMKRLQDMGRSVSFLNTFRPPFFDYNPYDIIRHLSVTSVMNLYAGRPFYNLEDLREGLSVFQDITNESLRLKGFDVPLFEPEEAGAIIGKQAQNFYFSLFEFFQTDRAGHSRDMDRAMAELVKLERFLQAILQTVDLETTLIVVTSDHGNIEDLSFRGHTTNMAMTLLFGQAAGRMLPQLSSITDVTPCIVELSVESRD
jgi:2,3-bisphosphoglycerate-independent phosphoglycerate mutase